MTATTLRLMMVEGLVIGTVMAMAMVMEMEVQVQARAWVVVRAALTSPQVAAMCGEVAAVAAEVVQVAGAVEVAKVGLGLGSAAAEAEPPVGAREDQWTQQPNPLLCWTSTGPLTKTWST